MAATSPLPEARSLPNPPTDGISSLGYLSDEIHLASTSWDGSVRLHETSEENASCVLSHFMESGPLLSLATAATTKDYLLTGGLDGSIRKLDIPTTTLSIVGRHSATPDKLACSCLDLLGGSAASNNNNSNVVVSAGWNSKLHLWDVRVSDKDPMMTVSLPGKAFDMDLHKDHNRVVVVTSGRRVCFVDIRKNISTTTTEEDAKLVLNRESSLKFQTRCVRFFPNGQGIAMGSIEGRVAVEYLEELGMTSGKKKYAFKCHRVQDTVYPVNAIAFHPTFGTFATGGCDGSVITWDPTNKKKLATLPTFATSISALAYSPSGRELAIASSYTFEEGERDHPRDEIFVRTMLDSECQPKTTK